MGFSGGRRGQQQFATQTLRVHLLGLDKTGKMKHSQAKAPHLRWATSRDGYPGYGEVRVYRGTGGSCGVQRTTWECYIKGFGSSRIPAGLPHTLGYACTFYAPHFPSPIIAETLARVIAAIRISSVLWQSYLPPKHRN